MLSTKTASEWTDLLYLVAVLRNQPRPIDQYIDYFGLNGEMHPEAADVRDQ